VTSPGGLQGAVRGALAIDRNGFQPLIAVRAAAGVVVPVAIGTAVGHPADGAIAAAGALPAGVAGIGGGFTTQAGVIVATGLGMSASTFVGSLVAGHTAFMLMVLALWAFGAGLVVVLGRSATIIGTQAVMGLIVFGRYPGAVDVATLHAAWVFAGAGFQGVLAAVFRSPQRFAAERRTLAAAYAELAANARDPRRSSLPAASQISAATRLINRRPSGQDLDLLRGLADEADRVRLELQSIATLAHTDLLRDVSVAAADWLDQLAGAIRAGDCAPDPPPLVAAVDALRSRRDAATAGIRGSSERYAAARATALLGQLQAIDRLTNALAGVRRIVLPRSVGSPAVVMLPRRTAESFRQIAMTLRDVRSAAFRHAVRLAVVLPLGEGLSHLLPGNRGYWMPLTAVVVLKPDFAATTQRGFARLGGTALGVAVAGLVVVGIKPSGAELTIMIAVTAWAAYSTFAASYALYSFAVTAIVVLLLAPLGGNQLSTVGDRGLDTLAGGALAMLAYLAWPSWERETLAANLAKLLQALASYTDVMLAAYADPKSIDHARIASAAAATARARMAAQASYDRAVAEPSRGRADLDTAVGVLAATRRVAIELHALRATIDDADEHVAVPEVGELRERIVAALQGLAVREAGVTVGLRDLQSALADDDRADLTSLRHRRRALLAAHLDPLVDSVDTVAHVLTGA
jgi:uncharacterized membrane protein YccC